MYNPAFSSATYEDTREFAHAIPPVFCWTKVGSEAGQPLADIIRRKELERQSGNGVFAWGIGNSVGPAIKYAKCVERIAALHTLFTSMKVAPKAMDAAPSSVLLWLGYHTEDGQIERLPDHMLVTSRGHYGAGADKRSHYALICRSHHPLASQGGRLGAIDHRAVRNLVSSNPVGASQVTSVVRYRRGASDEATYPVLFRATLTEGAFVRLAVPVLLTGTLYELYRVVCASSSQGEWREHIKSLQRATGIRWPERTQCSLF